MEGLLARGVDPSTSHDAAIIAACTVSNYQERFMDALMALGIASTANEVALSIETEHGARESIRKRCGELLNAGLIREFGKRQCFVTGHLARTFVVAGWTCPACQAHRSDAWLLGSEPTECETCRAIQERINERAAIAEYEGGLSRHDAEQLALNEAGER